MSNQQDNLPVKPGFNPDFLIAYIVEQKPSHIVDILDEQMASNVSCLQHNPNFNGVEFVQQYTILRNLRNTIAKGITS